MEPKVFKDEPIHVFGEEFCIDPHRLRRRMAIKYGRGNFLIKVRPVILGSGFMTRREQLRCCVLHVFVRQGVDIKEFTLVRDNIVYFLPLLISG
jgi:hypothetical protein